MVSNSVAMINRCFGDSLACLIIPAVEYMKARGWFNIRSSCEQLDSG